MFIVLFGDTDNSLKTNEILSCSAFIIPNKQGLMDLINRGKISSRTRVFEISRELNILVETQITFTSAKDGKKVASFVNQEDLSIEYRLEEEAGPERNSD